MLKKICESVWQNRRTGISEDRRVADFPTRDVWVASGTHHFLMNSEDMVSL